jgi:hypothetical protein
VQMSRGWKGSQAQVRGQHLQVTPEGQPLRTNAL